MLDRLHAHGRHQVVQRDSPPCLAVQVVESVLQGLGFGQKFPAAGVVCASFAAGIEGYAQGITRGMVTPVRSSMPSREFTQASPRSLRRAVGANS